MKILDNYYYRNLHNNPNKKLTPILLIGNIILNDNGVAMMGINNDTITTSDRNIISKYQDFTENYIIAIGPMAATLKFFNKKTYEEEEEKQYDIIEVLPALQSSPKINESIDLRSKRIKIGNSTANVTNINVRNSDLSSMLKDFVVEGKEVRLLYVNTDMLKDGEPYPIQVDDLIRGTYSENINATQMFFGNIHTINATKNGTIINIEDAAYNLFSYEIPRARIPDNDSIQDRYKLQPFPMSYGEVQKAPLVIYDINPDDNEFYILADDTFDSNRNFTVEHDPEKVYLGNDKKTYFRIPRLTTLDIKRNFEDGSYEEFSYVDAIQIITDTGTDGTIGNYLAIGSEHYNEDDVSPNPYSDGMLHLSVTRTPKKVGLEDKTLWLPGYRTNNEGEDLPTPFDFQGNTQGFTIIDKDLSFDEERATSSIMPNLPESAIQTVGFVNDTKLHGPGLSLNDVRSSGMFNGYPVNFMSDNSKGNRHGNAYVDYIKTPTSDGGCYGPVFGSGLDLFYELAMQNENTLIPSDIEDSWNETQIDSSNVTFDTETFPQEFIDGFYDYEYEDIQYLIDEIIAGEYPGPEASVEFRDALLGAQAGKCALGFWSIEPETITEATDGSVTEPKDMLQALIGTGGLFQQTFGVNKQPVYVQHANSVYESYDNLNMRGLTQINSKKYELLWNDLINKTWAKELWSDEYSRGNNSSDASLPEDTPFHNSYIEAMWDKLNMKEYLQIAPYYDEEGVEIPGWHTSGFLRTLASVILHSSGMIGGIQCVLYDEDDTNQSGHNFGNVRQVIFPWNIELEKDHTGVAWENSTLKFFRHPDNLTTEEQMEGWTDNSVGNTLWHWFISVSPFIAALEGYEETESEFISSSVSYPSSTYESGALTKGTKDVANSAFYNEQENFIVPNPNQTGDLTTGWSERDSWFYFASLTNGFPYSDLRLFGSDNYLMQFNPRTAPAGFMNRLKVNTTDEFGPGATTSFFYNSLYHHNSPEQFWHPEMVIQNNKIGEGTSPFLKALPEIRLIVTDNGGGLIESDTDFIHAKAFRLVYNFDGIADKDIFACGTHWNNKFDFNIQEMDGVGPSDNFMYADIWCGTNRMFQICRIKYHEDDTHPDDLLIGFKFDTENTDNTIESSFYVSSENYDIPENFIDNELSESSIYQKNISYGSGYLVGNELLQWRQPNQFSSIAYHFYAAEGCRANFSLRTHEAGVKQECLITAINTNEYFADITGRYDPEYLGIALTSAVDIVSHILVDELGVNPGLIDHVSREKTKLAANLYGQGNWRFDFSLKDIRNGKTYIEKLCEGTNFTVKISPNGKVKFTHLPDHYDLKFIAGKFHGYDFEIDTNNIIKYKFDTTPKGKLITRINIKYHQDYMLNKTVRETGFLKIEDVLYDKYGYEYDFNSYGIDQIGGAGTEHPRTTREYSFPEVQDEGTARRIRKFMLLQNCNTKLELDVTLDSSYSYVETGDICYIPDLIDNNRPFGEDYTRFEVKNGQMFYPLFIVTSVNKRVNEVRIGLERLQRLDYGTPVPNSEIIGKNIEQFRDYLASEYMEDSETLTQTFADRGISWTSEDTAQNGYGNIRIAHNPFLTDEFSLPTFNENNVNVPRTGDSNGDGLVNVLDVVTLVQYILGQAPLEDMQNNMLDEGFNVTITDVLDVIDFNQDNVVNILDVVGLCIYILQGEISD